MSAGKLLLLLLLTLPSIPEAAATADSAAPGQTAVDLLLLSPAELHRFQAPELGLALDRTVGHERQAWDGGVLTDDWTAATTTLRLVRPATPSLTWSATLVRYSEWDLNADVSGTKRRSLLQATVLGPDAAFKILDQLVLAAGVAVRRVEVDPGTDSAWALNHPVFHGAALLKGEAWEAGWAETVFTWRESGGGDNGRQSVREILLHGRYRTGGGSWLGALIRESALPPCCLAPKTPRRAYSLTAEGAAAGFGLAAAYTYTPAFVADYDYDITRHALWLQASTALARGYALSLRLTGEFGRDAHAAVRIPAALGTTDQADMQASAWSAGLALSRPL